MFKVGDSVKFSGKIVNVHWNPDPDARILEVHGGRNRRISLYANEIVHEESASFARDGIEKLEKNVAELTAALKAKTDEAADLDAKDERRSFTIAAQKETIASLKLLNAKLIKEAEWSKRLLRAKAVEVSVMEDKVNFLLNPPEDKCPF